MEDPYKTLSLEPGCNLDEVHRAFSYIQKIYHPDKGGNRQQYLRFLRAYKTIINMNVSVPDTAADYTYNVDELMTGKKERDATEYKRQYSQVTAEAENIRPMFKKGMAFNSQTFNKVFTQMKNRHGKKEEVLEDPAAAVIGGHGVELNDPQGRHEQSDYDRAFDSSPMNPQDYSQGYLESLRNEPDLTTEKKLSMTELKKRMATYQSASLPMPPATREQDHFSRMIELRNPMYESQASAPQQPPAQPPAQQQAQYYTQPPAQYYTHQQASQPLAQQQAQYYTQQQAVQPPAQQQAQYYTHQQAQYYAQPQALLQPHVPQSKIPNSYSEIASGRPPPLKKSKPKGEQDELAAMRKIIKQQERMIQQMLSKHAK